MLTLLTTLLLAIPAQAPTLGPWLGRFEAGTTRIVAYGWDKHLTRMPQVAIDEEPAKRVKPGDPRLPKALQSLKTLPIVTTAGLKQVPIRYFLASPGGSVQRLEIVLGHPLTRRVKSGLAIVPRFPAKRLKGAPRRWGRYVPRPVPAEPRKALFAAVRERHTKRTWAGPGPGPLGLGDVTWRALTWHPLGKDRRVVVMRQPLPKEQHLAGVWVVDKRWAIQQEIVAPGRWTMHYTVEGVGDVTGDGVPDFALETHYLDRNDVHLWTAAKKGYAAELLSSDGG